MLQGQRRQKGKSGYSFCNWGKGAGLTAELIGENQ